MCKSAVHSKGSGYAGKANHVIDVDSLPYDAVVCSSFSGVGGSSLPEPKGDVD